MLKSPCACGLAEPRSALREGSSIRLSALAILVVLLVQTIGFAAAAGSNSSRPGFEGTWRWSEPHVLVAAQGVWLRPNFVTSFERGHLEIGPNYGTYVDWTVDLPSALIGCRGGQPTYAPKVNNATYADVYLSGTCVLNVSGNKLLPDWQASTVSLNGPATVRAGPMRGEGVF